MCTLPSALPPGAPKARDENVVIGRTSMLHDDVMAACGILGVSLTRKGVGKLSKVSCNSAKPKKMPAEQEAYSWKDCEKRYSFLKLLKNEFERMNLNEIEHSKC